MNFKLHKPLVIGAALSLALAALTGCEDKTQPAANPAATATPAPAATAATAATPASMGPTAAVPVELTMDERRAATVKAPACNLGRANAARFEGQPVDVDKNATVRFEGWVADVTHRTVPATAELRMKSSDGKHIWKVDVQTGKKRLDVAKDLGDQAVFANVGYVSEVDARALPADTYSLYMVFPGPDGLLLCDNGRQIQLH